MVMTRVDTRAPDVVISTLNSETGTRESWVGGIQDIFVVLEVGLDNTTSEGAPGGDVTMHDAPSSDKG